MKLRRFWPNIIPLTFFSLALTGLLMVSPIFIPEAHAQETKLMKLRLGIPGLNPNLMLLAAQKWGLFKENGLDIEFIFMRSSVAMAALSQGHIDYFAGVGGASVGATLSGLPARAVWFAGAKLDYKLVARDPFKTIQDLRGKKVGSTGRGGTTDVALNVAMKKKGADSKDFVIVRLPARSELQSLDTGFVDAALLRPPFLFEAIQQGYNMVLDVGSLVEMPLGGLTGLVSKIENKPDEVKRVIRSLQQAKQALVDSKGRAIAMIGDVLKLNEKVASASYDVLLETISRDGVPTPAGMENVVNALRVQGRFTDRQVKFEEVADTRLAKEVAKEMGY